MKRRGKVEVWKHSIGMFVWECKHEVCLAPDDSFRSGASIHWEIAQHQADVHARGWHAKRKHTPRDVQTPPGGSHFEWSDTGMHVRVAGRQEEL